MTKGKYEALFDCGINFNEFNRGFRNQQFYCGIKYNDLGKICIVYHRWYLIFLRHELQMLPQKWSLILETSSLCYKLLQRLQFPFLSAKLPLGSSNYLELNEVKSSMWEQCYIYEQCIQVTYGIHFSTL